MSFVQAVQANPDKPIRYGSGDLPYENPYDIRFKPAHGWTVNWTILMDHRGFKRLPQFRTWTTADHIREAKYAWHAYIVLQNALSDLTHSALTTYGGDGALISGVCREHFPSEVKDILRMLAHRSSRESNRSFVHWRAARRTRETWLQFSRAEVKS